MGGGGGAGGLQKKKFVQGKIPPPPPPITSLMVRPLITCFRHYVTLAKTPSRVMTAIKISRKITLVDLRQLLPSEKISSGLV